MTVLNHPWSPPPKDLVLQANDVHIWRVHLNLATGKIEQLAQTLSTDEQQRAARFHFEKHRQHFIVGRGMLRTILGHYLNLKPNQLEFSYSSRGKPTLANTDTNQGLYFNLSHSNELALYAVMPASSIESAQENYSLGIDLEYMRPMPEVEKLAQRFFCPRESTLISSLSPALQQEAFFKGWTRKEAYLKATGDGLAGLEQVEVSLNPGEPAALLSIKGNQEAACHWSMYDLIPAPSYAAALVVEGHGWQLQRFAVAEPN
ncbi:MAG: 4'-phosphopantetheinyl transferase superfamily protein [Symploca sp. SIO3C6]|nr:4'-phosphopantetheinyl transferase superfamily protein [Symploca sp. SIO3C6]